MVKRSLLLCCILCAFSAKAQLLDSIRLFTQQRPKLVVKLDSRGSFISNVNVKMVGVKVGLEHAGRFQYGIGYTFLNTPITQVRFVEGQGEVLTKLRFGYVTPYMEYAFYERKHWEVRIPVQLGFGDGALVYEDTEGQKQKLGNAFVFLYEPSMTVQYRFLKYFGVSAGWGYRLVLTRVNLDERLTAPIYLYGIKVFFGDLWQDIQR
ncbi:MAG: hypothetical protein ABI373_03780 [Flavobacteriales bacterium]